VTGNGSVVSDRWVTSWLSTVGINVAAAAKGGADIVTIDHRHYRDGPRRQICTDLRCRRRSRRAVVPRGVADARLVRRREW